MSRSDPPISVAEALEREPGDDAWINEGVHGIVQEIKPSVSQKGKKFWRVTLRDQVNGAARIGFSIFFAPKFTDGDAIEITGKGIKRKEYQGDPELGMGKETEFHVTGRGVHSQQPANGARGGQAPAENSPPPASTASSGFFPHGQTVGASMKQAIDLITRDLTGDQVREAMSTRHFWEQLHMRASDLIRVHTLLEKGKLAPSLKDRMAPARKEEPPKTPPQRTPPPPAEDDGEDVPF